MEIVVCIKQVPDVPTIRMDRERMTIIREGVESVINPLDDMALEAALDLRAGRGGRVTVITMGPLQSEAALREALAIGADRAIHLTDRAFAGADTLATSHVLATAISKLDPRPDLVLCGMHTTDSDTGHVGPQIAEELELPQVCGVREILGEENALVVKRLSDGFIETIRVSLPALLTVARGVWPTRDLPLGHLESAFTEKKILRWGMDDLDLAEEEVGLSGSATRVWKLRPPFPRKQGVQLTGEPVMLAGRFIEMLEALNILDEEDEKR